MIINNKFNILRVEDIQLPVLICLINLTLDSQTI